IARAPCSDEMGRVFKAYDPRVALEDLGGLGLTIVITQVQAYWKLRRLSPLIADSTFFVNIPDRHALTGTVVAQKHDSPTSRNRFDHIIRRADGRFSRLRQCKRYIAGRWLQTAG